MQYEDRVAVATPEGIEIELTLAGLGSRMSAALVDALLLAVLLLVEVLVVSGLLDGIGADPELAGGAAAGVGFFVIIFYGTLFEAFRGGQTPGKRSLNIRVVGDHGEPVDFRMAFTRNLMLLVDVMLTLFLAGLIAIVRSERSQRLGDMAAGTLVVDTRDAAGTPAEVRVSMGAVSVLERAGGWDVSAISEQEVETIRHFLGRRGSLEGPARTQLARALSERVRPRVIGADPGLPDEYLLEIVAALKARS